MATEEEAKTNEELGAQEAVTDVEIIDAIDEVAVEDITVVMAEEEADDAGEEPAPVADEESADAGEEPAPTCPECGGELVDGECPTCNPPTAAWNRKNRPFGRF